MPMCEFLRKNAKTDDGTPVAKGNRCYRVDSVNGRNKVRGLFTKNYKTNHESL